MSGKQHVNDMKNVGSSHQVMKPLLLRQVYERSIDFHTSSNFNSIMKEKCMISNNLVEIINNDWSVWHPYACGQKFTHMPQLFYEYPTSK